MADKAQDQAGDGPLTVTHADMDAAFGRGEVVPLADDVSWIARYGRAWWVMSARGWLRITDDLVAADLDRAAVRFAAGEAAARGSDLTAEEDS
ncbi:MAG: hypothetical protein J2P26_14645 [Nocardiopsaceae bacterium]|nr:hypothetical protein [Nocardiopsaceae bacterium]